MKTRPLSRIMAMLLVIVMFVSILPMSIFAASGYDDGNGGSDYYNVISEKEWDIAPGIKEYEQVRRFDCSIGSFDIGSILGEYKHKQCRKL